MDKKRMIEKIKNRIFTEKDNLLYYKSKVQYCEEVINLYKEKLNKINREDI